jgi:hypothetical protein
MCGLDPVHGLRVAFGTDEQHAVPHKYGLLAVKRTKSRAIALSDCSIRKYTKTPCSAPDLVGTSVMI